MIVFISGLFIALTAFASDNTQMQRSHGVAVGDVDSRSAVIGLRSDRLSAMKVAAWTENGKKHYAATLALTEDKYTDRH